jgi:cytochrome c biogenesis factor
MENKRSKGITILAWLFIVSMASVICSFVLNLSKVSASVTSEFRLNIIYDLFIPIILLILAVNILRLKEWARKGIVYYFIIVPLGSLLFGMIFNMHIDINDPIEIMTCIISLLVQLGVILLIIYFFTRPKVKEQFR